MSNPPIGMNNLVVLVAREGDVSGQISYATDFPSPGLLSVFTFNAADAATDASFSIAVWDLSP
jgi:hypothetical protein